MIDLAALLLLAVFGALGAWRGALMSGFRLLALVAGYALAAHAAVVSGPRVAEALDVAPWVAAPLAAIGAFVASQVLFAVVGLGLRSFDRRRLAEGVRSGLDRLLGAAFGLVRGGAVVLLVGWLLLFVDALRVTGAAEDLPDLSGAVLPRLSGGVAEGAAGLVLGDEDPGSRVVARMAGRPAETAERLQGVLEHPRFEALQRDARFWSHLERGEVEAALSRPSLQHLSQDRRLREDLGALGMIDGRAAASPRAFRDALGEGLREVAPRLQRLRSDPEAQRLLEDGEVRDLLEAGDLAALLAREDFRDLVSRMLEPPGAPRG